MRLFIDSSAFVADALRRDQHHDAAVAAKQNIPRHTTIYTSDYVLDETITRIQSASDHATAVRAGERILASSRIHMIHVGPADVAAAWERFRQYQDKKLSFTDCTILAQVEHLRIDQLFTFDQGFAAMGVRTIP